MGVFGSNYSTFDLYLTAGFGLMDYVLRKLDCEPAPLILRFIFGPMKEDNFRRAMVLSEGDITTFMRSPISAAFLALGAIMLILICVPSIRRRRDEMTAEE